MEYCNNVFNEKHIELMEKRKSCQDLSEEDYDYLALHLSFYLACWGCIGFINAVVQRL